ncbi:DUF3592 domain-containing protein [Nannocystis exedens]
MIMSTVLAPSARAPAGASVADRRPARLVPGGIERYDELAMSTTAEGERMDRLLQRARLVAMGPPPRPSRGGMPDVYHYQMEPIAKSLRTRSPLVRGLFWACIVYVSVLSLGLAPLLIALTRAKQARRLDPLFEHGVACEGEVTHVLGPGGWTVSIAYIFTVAGKRYTGHMEYPARLREDWHAGDAVTVLYAPHDPADNIGLFR